MKDINEAYGILKNQDTKSKYDSEYIIFQNRHHKQRSHSSFYDENSQRGYSSTTANYNPGREHYYEYDIHDDDLKQDINTARKAAETFVEELIISLKHDSKIVVSGALGEAKYYIISAIIISVLFGIIQLFT